MSNIQIIRSLCQEKGDPDLRPNISIFIESGLELDGVQKNLFDLIKEFSQKYNGGLPSIDTLVDLAKKRYKPKSTEEAEASELKKFSPHWGDNFLRLVDELKNEQVLESAKKALSDASRRIDELKGKKDFDTFRIVQTVTGDAATNLFRVQERCRRSDKRTSGDIMDQESADEFIQDKAKKMGTGGQFGLFSGYETIDRATRGFFPGEVVLIAGYTGELKSTLCRNIMYNMSIRCGYNVLYFPCEQLYETNYDLLAAMHSTHEKWGGRTPLKSKDIETVMLSDDDFAFLQEVVNDFAKGQKERDYGHFIIEPPKDRALRWSDIVLLTQSYDAQLPGGVDAICVDYYEWVEWDGPRTDDSPINEMIKASKQFALSFRDGHGLVFLAPFQMNNDGYNFAQKHDGQYDVSHLSTHNQSRRAGDVILSTYLGPPASQYRQANQTKVACLKMRGGSPFPPLILQTALASSKILNSTLSMASDENSLIDASQINNDHLNSVLRTL